MIYRGFGQPATPPPIWIRACIFTILRIIYVHISPLVTRQTPHSWCRHWCLPVVALVPRTPVEPHRRLNIRIRLPGHATVIRVRPVSIIAPVLVTILTPVLVSVLISILIAILGIAILIAIIPWSAWNLPSTSLASACFTPGISYISASLTVNSSSEFCKYTLNMKGEMPKQAGYAAIYSLVPNSVTTIFWFSLIGRRETIRKTERQRTDVSNLFKRFMIYKGQTCAFIIWKLPDVFATSSF